MTQTANERPQPRTLMPANLEPSGPPPDVVELIMAEHRRIRRLGEALYDTARWPGSAWPGRALSDVWLRLAGLLQAHTRAEEEICHLPMSWSGPHAAELTAEAAADHGDIREAISEAALHPAGSDLWWRAVRAAIQDTTWHLRREESGLLAGGLPWLTVSRRRELGRQWSAFITAWSLDAAAPVTDESWRGGWAPGGTGGGYGRATRDYVLFERPRVRFRGSIGESADLPPEQQQGENDHEQRDAAEREADGEGQALEDAAGQHRDEPAEEDELAAVPVE